VLANFIVYIFNTLTHTRYYKIHETTPCNKNTMLCGYFDTTREGNHCSLLTPTVVGGQRPLLSQISAQSDPPLQKMLNFAAFRL